MKKFVVVCACVVMMGLAGCGLSTRNYYAKSNTTVEEVKARWGACKSIENLSDGSEKWAYPLESSETSIQYFVVKNGRVVDAWAE